MKQYTFLATTVFFALENPSPIWTIRGFMLTTDKIFLGGFPRVFYDAIGHFELDTIKKVPLCIKFGTMSEQDEYNLCQRDLDSIHALLSFLWFVKDCCAGAGCLFTYQNSDFKTSSFRNDKSFCNSEGNYKTESFTISDLEKALEVNEKIQHVINYSESDLDPTIQKSQQSEESIQKLKADHTFLAYNKRHRIERALMFLHQARSEQFLPLKIAFYIGLYETLFTTDGTELSHKVSERIAFYMGESAQERKDLFKLVKDAYGVRSSFMHGQTLQKFKTNSTLAPLSKSIDQLTRQILTKVIFDDSHIFSKDNNALNDWFVELVFGKSADDNQQEEEK